jgi:hypothetical protein
MTCIKTGCVAYLDQYQEWVHGDAYQYGDTIVIRVVHRTYDLKELAQFGNVRHFTILNINDWFDKEKTSQKTLSTLIAPESRVIDHGYEGIYEPQLALRAMNDWEIG